MMQAMIFAAGLGTRLKPITDTMPKALVRVGGVPLIEHVIGRLRSSGTDRIVVNVHHFASQVTDFLRSNDNFGIDIGISDESAMLLDTGGGLKKAAPFSYTMSTFFVTLTLRGCIPCMPIMTRHCSLASARPSVICCSMTI